MGFAVNGVSRATMTTTGVTVTGTITPTGSVHAASGTVGNPSLAFNADQNTGLYNIGADNIGVAAGGQKVLDVATTGLGVTGTLSVSGVATLGAGAILNTPASATLTNATGLPISTGVSGLGANVAAFLATPTSANLAAALTDETGTGANVFATSPTLTTPISATLTAPAATALTLAGGSSGASLVLGQGANAGMSITPSGTGAVNLINSVNVNGVTGVGKLAVRTGTDENAHFRTATAIGGTGVGLDMLNDANGAVVAFTLRASATRLTGGVVSITDSTAGSAGAGALVVTGGLSAGGASYFGGAVTGADYLRSKYGTLASPGIQVGDENAGMFVSGGYLKFKGGTSGGIVFRNAADTADVFYVLNNGNMNTTGAATFGGAVTIGNTVNAVSPTSPNRTITMVVNGVTLYIAAKLTND
jgi:hypothetical protein